MNNQNHEIVPQKMNEIESLNKIVELEDFDLEIINGGDIIKVSFVNTGQYSPQPNEVLPSNTEISKKTLNSILQSCLLKVQM